MNKRTMIIMVMLFAFILAGCAASKKSIAKSLTEMGAASCESIESIKSRAGNYEASSGLFIKAGPSVNAQDLYDELLRNYNDMKDSDVSDGLFFVRSSYIEDNNLNTYFVSVTFKNEKDANAMYDCWVNMFSSIGTGHGKTGVNGYRYSVYWHGNIKSMTGLELERGMGVYQTGKQVMFVSGLHPSGKEDKVMHDLCDKLGLVFPFEAA